MRAWKQSWDNSITRGGVWSQQLRSQQDISNSAYLIFDVVYTVYIRL